MQSLKERKIDFVSNLTGGTTIDIYFVTCISALGYLLWSVLKKKSLVSNDDSILSNSIDFLLNWNLLLLSITVYSTNTKLLTSLLIFPIIILSFLPATTNEKQKSTQKKTTTTTGKKRNFINLSELNIRQFLPYKAYITVYRSQMMIITCLAILAVDFKVFPRRFAKVETWGTSLMDLGVGSFVFSMGLVNCRNLLKEKFQPSSNSKLNYFKSILKSTKVAFPILALGFIRLISVKSVEYHEHVSEYGYHWNFFFTLGFLPILNSILKPILLKPISSILIIIFIVIFYEIILIKFGFLNFIVNESLPRDNLISQNKEGLFSFIGYLSIFLVGQYSGNLLLPIIPIPNNLICIGASKQDLVKYYSDKNSKNSKTTATTLKPLKALVILSVGFQLLYFIIDTCYVYSVSRRLANGLYVIWVCAYNLTFLTGFKLIENLVWGDELNDENVAIITNEDGKNDKSYDTVDPLEISKLHYKESTPLSLQFINDNSLIIFLIANLLTGLINLTFNTIDSSDITAIMILIVYELVLYIISLVLNRLNIIIR
ncbi:unnamed protein product [[Candida] boidinii]|uniref:GPI-anchored wall transfer protein n=1 Tax=Candida boidinii TaxID=5477 RepID=A0A9W6T9K2_CANBO|nr:unnamed protein product [[Candida] boidinii]GMG08728.1 unnamed protein product [[Candida] boidinii]